MSKKGRDDEKIGFLAAALLLSLAARGDGSGTCAGGVVYAVKDRQVYGITVTQ